MRHHLSLNRLFERQARPVTDPGFGSYWTVNLEAPPGTKRPRKRGRANKGDSSASNEVKRRGRPKKLGHESFVHTLPGLEYMPAGPPQSFRNVQYGPSHSPSPCLRMTTFVDESNETIPPAYDQSSFYTNASLTSDEANEYYDSEDVAIAPSPSANSISPYPNSPKPKERSPFVSESAPERSGGLFEQLHMEVRELRRQTSLASVMSVRMSQELSAAKDEIEQLRNRNEHLEQRLEVELYRRSHNHSERQYDRYSSGGY